MTIAKDYFIIAVLLGNFLISFVGGKTDTDDQPTSLIENSLEEAVSFAAEICQLPGAFGHGLRY